MTASVPPPPWRPCSDRSRDRHDPIAATAGVGERWFLLEIDGAWGQHAFLDSGLDPSLARALVARIEGAGMRPLAIRRTGRRADERRARDEWSWAIADVRSAIRSLRWGTVSSLEEVLEVPLDGSAGAPSEESIVCVCAHARHDQCCAVRGRPVVEALADALPDRTWECSHLGGDRFAATMMLFPQGLLYGRVPPEAAVRIVERADEGLIEPDTFRGETALPAVEQAACAYARAASGDDRIDAYRTLAVDESADGWRVRLAHDGGADLELRLVRGMSEPLLSTCAATLEVRVPRFELAALGAA